MTRTQAAMDFGGSLAAAERLWFDTSRWHEWVDGFGRLARVSEDWPHAGAVVEWDSTPAGRGHVVERVSAYEPGAVQTSAVEDPSLSGIQAVAFEQLEGGVGVTLTLAYKLRRTNPIVDWLFVRRALRDSLRRTLRRFGEALATDLELRR